MHRGGTGGEDGQSRSRVREAKGDEACEIANEQLAFKQRSKKEPGYEGWR